MRTCDVYAKGMKVWVGFSYAKLQFRYLREVPLELYGNGPDLTFAITREWLKNNQPEKHGLKVKDFDEFLEHVKTCQSDKCREAFNRFQVIQPYAKSGRFPGLDLETIMNLHENEVRVVRLISQIDPPDVVDQVKTFILWFTGENRNDWLWE